MMARLSAPSLVVLGATALTGCAELTCMVATDRQSCIAEHQRHEAMEARCNSRAYPHIREYGPVLTYMSCSEYKTGSSKTTSCTPYYGMKSDLRQYYQVYNSCMAEYGY